MFNLTNVELNICVSNFFLSDLFLKLNVLVVTNAFKILYRMSEKVLALVPFISCMAGKVFVMTHVLSQKREEVWGSLLSYPSNTHALQ